MQIKYHTIQQVKSTNENGIQWVRTINGPEFRLSRIGTRTLMHTVRKTLAFILCTVSTATCIAHMRAQFLLVHLCLSHVVSLVFSSEIAFLLSQNAANQVTDFGVQEGLRLLRKRPIAVYIQTKNEPFLGNFARVDLENRFAYNNISLELDDDLVGVSIDNLDVLSTADIIAEYWPPGLIGGNERIDLNLNVDRVFLSFDMKGQTIWLRTCTLSGSQMDISAHNYWPVDMVLSLVKSYVLNNVDSLACPFVDTIVESVETQFFGSIPLVKLINEQLLPIELHPVYLQYQLSSVRVRKGRIGIKVNMFWKGADAERTGNGTIPTGDLFHLELDQENHATLWIRDQVINDLMSLMRWDFLWMEDKIPLSSTKIPQSSRQFLSTLCSDCYFLLKVWNRGSPKLISSEDSISLNRHDLVNLRIVNPRQNLTAVFVSFVLNFKGNVVPFVDQGTLKAEINLVDAKVDMENGAFPPEWRPLVQDLIQGVIRDVVWPEIEHNVEKLTLEHGVVLPVSCGLEPSSVRILTWPDRFGTTADLRLSDLDLDLCRQQLTKALPRPPDELLQMER